ncbi:MAG: DUF1631 family protein [Pseudomonadales bacterium]|nr:DUF1631 family protein [Pseudomonadales bacterium]
MGRQSEPANVISALHHRVTGELLHLVDGLYANIEDGLFELAYRAPEEARKRRYFDLMREMRYRKSSLIQGLARRMQQALQQWFRPELGNGETDAEINALAAGMAERCMAHFGGVLRSLSERTAFALDCDPDVAALPIGPERIAGSFLGTMKALKFDEHAIVIVQDLFVRFVLDRLGPVYGDCNMRMQDAGFLTRSEVDELNRARA